MNKNIKEISNQLREWKAEKKHRAVIMIAIDATNAPFCEALVGVDGKQNLLVEALKIALPQADHRLALLTLAAIEELSNGLEPQKINLN